MRIKDSDRVENIARNFGLDDRARWYLEGAFEGVRLDARLEGAAVAFGLMGMAEAIRARDPRTAAWLAREPIDSPFLCSPGDPCGVFYTCAKHREG